MKEEELNKKEEELK